MREHSNSNDQNCAPKGTDFSLVRLPDSQKRGLLSQVKVRDDKGSQHHATGRNGVCRVVDTPADAKRVGHTAYKIARRAGLNPKQAATNRKIWEDAFRRTYL